MKNSAEFQAMRQRYQAFRKNRAAFHPSGSSWYSMEADNREAEVLIYDAIGFFGIEAQQFVQDLNELDVDAITLRINSPGGDIFDGSAIYNALRRHPAKVHTMVDGLAASMASVIALAGDTVAMASNAFFMIHKPWSIVLGNADDMRKEAGILDKLEASAVDIYANASGQDADSIREAMATETWYSADEARAAGYIDAIYDADTSSSKAARVAFDLSVFNAAPRGIQSAPREQHITPTDRGIEAALRDAGYSRSASKQAVLEYRAQVQREAATSEGGDLGELLRLAEKRGSIFTPVE